MLAKLFMTLLAVAAIWLGFKYYARFIAGPARRRAVPRSRPPASEPDPPPAGPIEDMTPCAVCGAYIPARGARRCGRHDCPF